MISWAMCTTFFLFVSSSCCKEDKQHKQHKQVSERDDWTHAPERTTRRWTHGLAAEHHDHRAPAHAPRGNEASRARRGPTAERRPSSPPPPLLSLPVSVPCCVLVNGNGGGGGRPFYDLILDRGLSPTPTPPLSFRSTEMSHRSLDVCSLLEAELSSSSSELCSSSSSEWTSCPSQPLHTNRAIER
ncbi:hypothetical protein EYF80_047401 [Liparis tanakae]|uniref:Secreted protein n=1 Tax=Liparis tanakae TaxID=230148 RepID=A0A4Z2FQ24_9TELE|nr:hypothetical protein EYF80_047401 [Liparis tanakae]